MSQSRHKWWHLVVCGLLVKQNTPVSHSPSTEGLHEKDWHHLGGLDVGRTPTCPPVGGIQHHGLFPAMPAVTLSPSSRRGFWTLLLKPAAGCARGAGGATISGSERSARSAMRPGSGVMDTYRDSDSREARDTRSVGPRCAGSGGGGMGSIVELGGRTMAVHLAQNVRSSMFRE